MTLDFLSPDKGYLFRLIHIENLEWDLLNGCHSKNSPQKNPNYVSIGTEAIVKRRTEWPVRIEPKGTLADYVPFYFTPLSPMQYNIATGYNGARKRHISELVIVATTIEEVTRNGCTFVYTDRHAALATARFQTDLNKLSELPWDYLRTHDFKHDPEKPDKFDRYQSEGLVHCCVPPTAILRVA